MTDLEQAKIALEEARDQVEHRGYLLREADEKYSRALKLWISIMRHIQELEVAQRVEQEKTKP